MNKKLMAVAVAGALSAPGLALAQASTVQIYGAIHVLYHRLDMGTVGAGGTPKPDMLQTSDSSVGFRGEESLGRGFTAWFQCESSLEIVGANSNGWCSRNTAIGMKTGWGNFFFGNWDTPVKKGVQNPVRGWWGLQNPYGISGQLFNGGQSGVLNTGTSFSRRQANSANYDSPVWGGFQFLAQYSSTNEATAQTSASFAKKPRLHSLAVKYDNGPLYIGGGYERHKNFNPAGKTLGPAAGEYSSGRDRNWVAGAAYTFAGVFKLSGILSANEYVLTNSASLKQKGWGIYGDWRIQGPHSLKLGVTKANDTKGNYASTVGFLIGNAGAGNTGGYLYAINYAYAFSKRTTGYLGIAKATNNRNANFPLQSSGPKPIAGESQNIIGMGARHSF